MKPENRTLLVVDGSMSILYYLGMLLTRLGYKVSTASSAEEALKIMDDAVPSLVVSEITLPKMNGITLLRWIKESPRLAAIPVIVLTSENDPGLKDTCLRAGCAGYLNKPIAPEMLYKAIQSACEELPRQYIRLQTSLKVIVRQGSILGGGGRTEYATAISEGGLYIRTLYPQPVNTLLTLTLFIDDQKIKAKAVVLYGFTLGQGPFQEPGMGMKFVEISDEGRDAIRGFIRKHLTGDLEKIAAQGIDSVIYGA